MTFKHKLAHRLARLKGRGVALVVALLATALAFACEKPLPLSSTGGTVADLVISPKNVTLHESGTANFTAAAFLTTGDSASVTVSWSATSGTVTDMGTSTSGRRHYGQYKAGKTAGQYKVVATGTPGGVSDTATVTVTPAPVAAVSVAPSAATIAVGATAQLQATTTDSAGNVLTGRAITWASNNAAVATVSGSGLVTAVGAGSATITATSEGQSGAASITVSSVPVASVAVTPTTVSLQTGQTAQFTATPKDASGNPLSGRVVAWSSSDTTIATVSASGLATARAAGAATITATSESKSGTAAITVTAVPVATVAVTPPSASVQVGQTLQLTATTKDANGNTLTGRAVAWSSSDTTIAKVSTSGLLTARAVGAATVTATSESKSGTAAITVTPPPPPGTHTGWYVTTSGSSSGSGTAASAWDLATALNGGNGKVQPGDTIWLRGGTYHGAFTSIVSGTAGAPVVVREYPGERAVIDGNGQLNDVLTVQGAWVVFQDFEIMDSNTDRVTTSPQRPHGVVNNAPHVKYVHLIVHDVGIGFYTYANQSVDVEIYGCLIYNNGWQGGGHAIYGKADVGPLLIRDNIIFTQFGYGLHLYSNLGDGGLNNITLRGNVSFDNGSLDGPTSGHANLLLGGEETVSGGLVDSNMTYYAPSVGVYNMELGYSSTSNFDVVFRDNYSVGGASTALQVGYWQRVTASGNVLYGPGNVVELRAASVSGYVWGGNTYLRDPGSSAWSFAGSSYTFTGWQSATGLGATDQATATLPSGPRVFLRKSPYEPGRANIVVYNWNGQGAVSVDVSGVLQVGDAYQVRNAQDFFGTPVLSGTYNGGMLSLPMTGVSPPLPIGGSPGTPPRTGPAFDVFVVLRPGG
jgi:uncharacterized protein YjdB